MSRPSVSIVTVLKKDGCFHPRTVNILIKCKLSTEVDFTFDVILIIKILQWLVFKNYTA